MCFKGTGSRGRIQFFLLNEYSIYRSNLEPVLVKKNFLDGSLMNELFYLPFSQLLSRKHIGENYILKNSSI